MARHLIPQKDMAHMAKHLRAGILVLVRHQHPIEQYLLVILSLLPLKNIKHGKKIMNCATGNFIRNIT